MKMPKTYEISAEQGREVAEARKKTNDKYADKRLYAVQLRGEGWKNKDIAIKLETSRFVVSQWIGAFVRGGVEALLPKRRTGRPTQISYAEEVEMLDAYNEKAKKGQIIEISEIRADYEARVGHISGGNQIYLVLRRHGWRKIMPRSKHPNKASDEVIEASKKLTLESES
jgi:transposase